MMNFRIVAQAIIDTLGASAGGAFRTVGYRGQGHAAVEVKNNKRMVQVYYSGGEFLKSAGRQTGATQHDIIFGIGLHVSAAAKVNLSAINSPGAQPNQIAAALSGLREASFEADQLMDDLSDKVYQILMDGENFDLGLPKGTMSSRWTDRISKDEPLQQGDLVVLTGSLQYSCRTVEEVTGSSGVAAGAGAITTTVDIIGDDIEQTVVSTTP